PPVIAFSPGGRLLGSANHDGSVTLWDTASMQRIGPTLLSGNPWPSGGKGGEPGTVIELSSLAVGADGRTVVAGSSDGSVYVWQYDTASSGDQQPMATADGPAGHLL